MHDVPENFVIDVVVTMDESIAQSRDAMKFRNPHRKRRIHGAGLVQGFADDLKLTLDRGAEKPVVFVDGEVTWRAAKATFKVSGKNRLISINNLPINHTTGTYPIASNDDAYKYDRNPNSIASHDFNFTFQTFFSENIDMAKVKKKGDEKPKKKIARKTNW